MSFNILRGGPINAEDACRALSQTVEEDIDEFRFKGGRFFERYSRPLIQDEVVLERIPKVRPVASAAFAECFPPGGQEQFV